MDRGSVAPALAVLVENVEEVDADDLEAEREEREAPHPLVRQRRKRLSTTPTKPRVDRVVTSERQRHGEEADHVHDRHRAADDEVIAEVERENRDERSDRRGARPVSDREPHEEDRGEHEADRDLERPREPEEERPLVPDERALDRERRRQHPVIRVERDEAVAQRPRHEAPQHHETIEEAEHGEPARVRFEEVSREPRDETRGHEGSLAESISGRSAGPTRGSSHRCCRSTATGTRTRRTREAR